MRRPSVVLVLFAILGLFACCAAVGSGRSWWPKRTATTTSRQDQAEGSNTRQTTEAAPTCQQRQSTNFDQSHHPQHVPSYNPHMSNIPQSTNFTHAPSLNTVQPRTKPKRSRLSRKQPPTVIQTDLTNFKARVQELTAMRESSTTTAGGNTQWTNPAGSANRSQNFQSQQTDGGWPNTNFFNPNHPKH
uniref:VQ domain-containing protein n=1 Tax=Globodera pallida TaxID=36090 RepID=A0A183BZE9_GLOPA